MVGNPNHQAPPAPRNSMAPVSSTGPGSVSGGIDGETRAEKKAREKAERDARADENSEQRRLDRLKKEEDKKQIALAKIEAAGTPQKTLNSILSGLETTQRLLAGEPDPSAIGAPVGAPSEAPGTTASLPARLFKSIGLPILIGLAVTALWYVLKPKH